MYPNSAPADSRVLIAEEPEISFLQLHIQNTYQQSLQQVRPPIDATFRQLRVPTSIYLCESDPSIFEIAFAPMATHLLFDICTRHPVTNTTSCLEHNWRSRRSFALRFASRPRRRNKRLNGPRSFAVFRRTENGHDLRLRYDHGCHTATILHGSLDMLTFLIWVAQWGSIWESHGWASSAGLFLRSVVARTRLQHSIDSVCHFFALSRSSINDQTCGDVSYGSGSRVCIL
jgi:hypothetical protein